MKKLGFGLMRLPLREAGNQSAIDTETGKEMVAKFLERGFTFFDTAYMYHEGKSEVFFKEAVLDRFPRESFTVTDKMPAMMLHHAHDLERIWHEQVERTGVTYYDYYWLHALNKNTVKTLDEIGGWEFMKKLKAEGKVRHIGFSFHDDSATRWSKFWETTPKWSLCSCKSTISTGKTPGWNRAAAMNWQQNTANR